VAVLSPETLVLFDGLCIHDSLKVRAEEPRGRRAREVEERARPENASGKPVHAVQTNRDEGEDELGHRQLRCVHRRATHVAVLLVLVGETPA
jgi:hypothetical protein